MSLLISPGFIIVIILFCNAFVSGILYKKVEKDVIRLITNIILIPAIPLSWLISSVRNDSPHIFFSFYLPLFFTVVVISMLVINIVKYNKNKR